MNPITALKSILPAMIAAVVLSAIASEAQTLKTTDFMETSWTPATCQFGIKIGMPILKIIVQNLPETYSKNTDFNKESAKWFTLTGLDATNNRLNIDFRVRSIHWEKLAWGYIKISDVACDASGTLTPSVTNKSFSTTLGNMTTGDCDFGGAGAVFAVVTAGAFAPIFGQNGIFGTLLLPTVATSLADNQLGTITKSIPVGSYTDLLKKITAYDMSGILWENSTKVASDGLWIYYKYNLANQTTIYNAIKTELTNIGVSTPLVNTDYLGLLNEYANVVLGRYLTSAEVTTYGDMLSNGKSLDQIKQVIYNTSEAISRRHMAGFNIAKCTPSQNTLIVSLSGAGVWTQATGNTSAAIETISFGEYPSTSDNFGDGIYHRSLNALYPHTVAVVAYPWFSGTGSQSIDASWWGPKPVEFAEKIRLALMNMAPNSRLVLLGKSMGGFKMQQIVNELKLKNVEVSLLVIVDGSGSPADHSGETMAIPSNVRKVVNYRQISVPPYNDGQNGFKISSASPTVAEDIVVGDEGRNIGSLMCEGVGHDDIDECPSLLSQIDMLLKATTLGGIIPAVNSN